MHWTGRFPARPETAYKLRREIAAIGLKCGLRDQGLWRLTLAVSEVVSNALQHAYRGREPGDISAAAYVEGGALRVVIADTGVGMAPRSDSPGLGLGLPLVAQTAQEVDVVSDHRGTEVHLTFPCPASAPLRDAG